MFAVFDWLRGQASIVIVEHNHELVLALADRVCALERGAVLHQGPAEPPLNDLEYRSSYFGHFVAEGPQHAARRMRGLRSHIHVRKTGEQAWQE